MLGQVWSGAGQPEREPGQFLILHLHQSSSPSSTNSMFANFQVPIFSSPSNFLSDIQRAKNKALFLHNPCYCEISIIAA
jgi:hypothetical protein